MNKEPRRSARALLIFFALVVSLPAHAAAPQREHLTPEEVEIIRDTQELDKRTAVFIKAAERRLLALSDPSAKQLKDDLEKWGEVKGTRTQLLSDVARILDEAVVNIDDAHTHNQKSPLLRRALYKLSEASGRFIPQLVPLRAAAQTEPEREMLEQAIEQAQQIVEAAKTHAINEDDAKEKSGKKGN
ncbi:MAG TPA: hypothetical protein VFS10_08040 [Pyrinomonadaceae bacterium]|nr:hypothetical protein [Pyrinomonadaceae bacterium]